VSSPVRQPVARIFDGPRITIRYRRDLRDTAGNPAHAATFIRQRLIVLDPALKMRPREYRRVLLHEYFHFVWVRLGNRRRRAWEELVATEWNSGGRGEAGWSSEWRRQKLSDGDVRQRSRRWRDYCCESFCDTAAWVTGRIDSEVTLSQTRRRTRRAWFTTNFGDCRFPI
jgi:hypothetical protein